MSCPKNLKKMSTPFGIAKTVVPKSKAKKKFGQKKQLKQSHMAANKVNDSTTNVITFALFVQNHTKKTVFSVHAAVAAHKKRVM